MAKEKKGCLASLFLKVLLPLLVIAIVLIAVVLILATGPAVTYPALVQNYCANWETTMAEGLLPEIALSSGLGSADPAMTACSGRSLLLEETNSIASINLAGTVVDATAEAIRAGFSIYVPEDEPATPGRLVRLAFGDRSGTAACTVEARLERVGEDDWQVAVRVEDGKMI